MNRVALAFLPIALICARVAAAQVAPTQPAATSPASTRAAGSSVLKVIAVEGKVRVRQGEGADWKVVIEGMELPEGVEIQTLPNSKVQLLIPPNEFVIVDRATRAILQRSSFVDGKLKRDMWLPDGGKLQYQIDKGVEEHDSTIHSPSSTLAVRGTQVALFDQAPFVPQAVSLTGTAQFQDAKKRIAFGGRGTAKVRADEPSAAAVALAESVNDPGVPRARTPAETRLIQDLVTQGSIVSFDPIRGIDTVRGGQVPQIADLMASLPGLNIVLSWTGNTNLDLNVSLAGKQEFLYPGFGLNQYPNGDHIPFDHRGGSSGGFEFASFPSLRPGEGETYFLGATYISGETAIAHFDAFMDHKPLNVTNSDLIGNYPPDGKPVNQITSAIGVLYGGTDKPPFSLPAKAAPRPASPAALMGPMPVKRSR